MVIKKRTWPASNLACAQPAASCAPAVSAGAYRQMQARLRSNSESIAFYGGIDKEATLLKDKFRQVLQHNGRLLVKQWQFGMVQVRPYAPDTCSDAAYFPWPELVPGPAPSCMSTLLAFWLLGWCHASCS